MIGADRNHAFFEANYGVSPDFSPKGSDGTLVNFGLPGEFAIRTLDGHEVESGGLFEPICSVLIQSPDPQVRGDGILLALADIHEAHRN